MNLFELFVKIGVDDQASKKIASISSKLGSGLKSAAKVAGAAVAAASTAVVAFGASSVKAGADFDESMSQVAATMGVTVSEIENLRDFAQQMGSTTAFSATQAADALNYMALAGYDAETSMNMLPNVLNLAAAGGIELAYASDMVTDAQSALGLSLDETAAMVDKIAKASSKTNTSVQQMGEAILTVGGTAKNLKGGTTELAQVLGLLADNGIKGAEGGTHLRNILLAMEPTTDAAAAAFEQLNLQTYDANGSLRNLEDIFLDMNAAMDGMTDQEKQNIITAIFNKTDIASVNALLATTEERWDSVSAAIDDSAGAAQAMANTQLDNLNGDITLFKSALEGAQIAISDKLTPTLRGFVQFGSKGLSELTEGFKEGGLSGAMDAFGSLLGEGLAMIAESLPEIVKAGVSLIEALITGISENGDLIITAAFDAVMVLADGILNMLPQIVKLGLDLIVSLANGIAESLPELIPTIVDVVLQIVETLTDPDTLSSLIDSAIAIIFALADGLIASLPALLEKAPIIVQNLVDAIVANAPKLLESALILVLKLVEGILANLPELVNSGIEMVHSILDGIIELLGDLVMKGKDIVDSVKKGFSSKVAEAKTWGKDMIQNFIDGITAKWQALKNKVSSVAQTVKNYLGFSEPKLGPLSNFHTYAPDMMDLFAKGIRDNENVITDQIEKSFDFGERTMKFGAEYDGKYGSVPAGGSFGGISFGDVYINVDGASYDDPQSLAVAVAQELQNMTDRRLAVYA